MGRGGREGGEGGGRVEVKEEAGEMEGDFLGVMERGFRGEGVCFVGVVFSCSFVLSVVFLGTIVTGLNGLGLLDVVVSFGDIFRGFSGFGKFVV